MLQVTPVRGNRKPGLAAISAPIEAYDHDGTALGPILPHQLMRLKSTLPADSGISTMRMTLMLYSPGTFISRDVWDQSTALLMDTSTFHDFLSPHWGFF
jgi:hypothetical protein